MAELALLLDAILRLVTLAAAVAAGLVALTHWAVRRGHLPAFGGVATGVRRLSDPILRPVERAVIRMGRNPQEAPLWLFGITVLAGLLLLTVSRWLMGFVLSLLALKGAGPLAWFRFFFELGFNLLLLALLVRVIGGWLGAGRFNRFVRPAHQVTDWIVEPIRRRLPPFGPLDLSPMVAFIALLILRALLLPLF